MRRLIVAIGIAIALGLASVLAHWALIETAGEVIVLRTEEPDGTWYQSRLWIVDDDGAAWLHGDRDSRWVRNLTSRPIVVVVRAGEVHRYRATPVPGPHLRLHELLRAKYGFADRWVRFVGADRESTTPVRLERMPPPGEAQQ